MSSKAFFESYFKTDFEPLSGIDFRFENDGTKLKLNPINKTIELSKSNGTTKGKIKTNLSSINLSHKHHDEKGFFSTSFGLEKKSTRLTKLTGDIGYTKYSKMFGVGVGAKPYYDSVGIMGTIMGKTETGNFGYVDVVSNGVVKDFDIGVGKIPSGTQVKDSLIESLGYKFNYNPVSNKIDFSGKTKISDNLEAVFDSTQSVGYIIKGDGFKGKAFFNFPKGILKAEASSVLNNSHIGAGIKYDIHKKEPEIGVSLGITK